MPGWDCSDQHAGEGRGAGAGQSHPFFFTHPSFCLSSLPATWFLPLPASLSHKLALTLPPLCLPGCDYPDPRAGAGRLCLRPLHRAAPWRTEPPQASSAASTRSRPTGPLDAGCAHSPWAARLGGRRAVRVARAQPPVIEGLRS